MRDDRFTAPVVAAPRRGDGIYRFVIVTLDAHAAGPAQRVAGRLAKDFPGIAISVHAAAEWAENPEALCAARLAVDRADLVIANLLFIEEHLTAILPDMLAVRERHLQVRGRADGVDAQAPRMVVGGLCRTGGRAAIRKPAKTWRQPVARCP